MRYKDWFPSNFFKADHLDEGPIPPLTIGGIAPEKMPNGEVKPVVSFREDKRRLVLSSTHAKTLELLTGSSDPKDAIGLCIQLVQVDTTFAGKPCKGIRITRPPAAQAPASKGGAPRSPKPDAAKPAPAAKLAGNAGDNDLNDEIPY